MRQTIEQALKTLRKNYSYKKVPTGEFETIRIYGIMKFKTRQYEVENLGNLCVMTLNMGLMKMLSFVLTPYEKDMPMISADYIYAMKNRKAYIEVYDLTEHPEAVSYQAVLSALKEVIATYTDLEDFTGNIGWYQDILNVTAYKAGKSAQDDRFRQLLSDVIAVYTAGAKKLPEMTEEEKAAKQQIIQKYVDTMVEKGGMAVNNFKKSLGDEKTGRFLSRVMFGPSNYIN